MIKKYTTILKAAVFVLTANSLVAVSPAQADNYSIKSITTNTSSKNTIEETRPFNNMLRKMVLLTEEVVTEKPTPADAAKAKDEATKTATADTGANNGYSPPAPLVEQKTADPVKSAAVPSSPEAKELELPELKDPEVPAVSQQKPLSTQSVTKPISDATEDGVVNKFFNNLEKNINNNAQSATTQPAPVSEEEIKKIIAKKRAKKETTPQPVKIQEKPSELSPVNRPDSNYRTQLLSGEVSKKSYSRENQHLPYAVYNEEYKRILFDSAAIGNLDILRAMVDNFQDTEVTDGEGNTPLIYASMAGNLQSVITLFSLGANLNARNSNGVSALYAATKLGRLDIVQFLLQRLADPDLPDNNDKTPLMVASEADFSRIAELLLKQDIDPNRKMRNGNTAIHFAVQNNSLTTLELLIVKKGNVDLKNFKGYTPLMLAVENNHAQAVSILINAGADVTKTTAQGTEISSMANGNSAILELIEGEKTRRELLSNKLAETSEYTVKKEVNYTQTETVAQRIDGIPIPILKPSTTFKNQPPKPLFTKEEKQKMQNPEL